MQVRHVELQTAQEDSQEIVEPEEVEPLMLVCGGTCSTDASTTLHGDWSELLKKSDRNLHMATHAQMDPMFLHNDLDVTSYYLH